MKDRTPAEKIAMLALAVSLANAAEIHRRDRWKRKLKDVLWPLV